MHRKWDTDRSHPSRVYTDTGLGATSGLREPGRSDRETPSFPDETGVLGTSGTQEGDVSFSGWSTAPRPHPDPGLTRDSQRYTKDGFETNNYCIINGVPVSPALPMGH